MPIRSALKNNPHRGEDMLVTFEMPVHFKEKSEKMPLRLAYVPDREILQESDFAHWVGTLCEKEWENPEAFVNTLLGTFYDEVLPFFLDIKLEISADNGIVHRLESIKSQPQYKMPEYLLRKI